MIIEPSEKRRETHFDIFKRWGYEVIFGKDGIDAITLSFHYLPQLVILSEGLSKMNEAQVVDTLKSDPLTSQIKVVLTGESSMEIDAEDYEFPFDGFFKTSCQSRWFSRFLKDLGTVLPSFDKKVA